MLKNFLMICGKFGSLDRLIAKPAYPHAHVPNKDCYSQIERNWTCQP